MITICMVGWVIYSKSLPCTVRTSRRGSCNQRVSFSQLGSKTFGPVKLSGPSLVFSLSVENGLSFFLTLSWQLCLQHELDDHVRISGMKLS